MEFVRVLMLIITSIVLVLHNPCAHAVHHQAVVSGRKLKGNSLVAGEENIAPAKMNGKASEAKTRYSEEKDEGNVNTEVNDREVMNMMLRDYGPRGKSAGRRKPPINNHNHKH